MHASDCAGIIRNEYIVSLCIDVTVINDLYENLR